MVVSTVRQLRERAFRIRQRIVRLATNGGCFVGASLSCVDILNYLYSGWLNFDFDDPKNRNRDYLLLSKGHDVPALYALFVELGGLSEQRLANHLKIVDDIYWHPNRRIKGVEFHSGSLGHLLSVGLGLALDIRMSEADNRVVVILGDGELNEGSVWEAVLVAGAKRLDNLIAVVDRNRFQANVATEDLIPLEPLEEKFWAFGWLTRRVDGHDYEDLDSCFQGISDNRSGPVAIIADTVRGKGFPSLTARADRWFCDFSAQEVEMLLEELEGVRLAELESAPLVVR